jgi:hypothetical protein
MNDSNEEEDKYARFLNAQKAAFKQEEPQADQKNSNTTTPAGLAKNEPAVQ